MKSRLISSIIMGLMTINVVVAADNASQRPKLVVGIVVDQLRTDYIEYLQSLFGEKGFRRLMEKGVFVSDLDFNADLRDAASATALLYTGAFPAVNGIAGPETVAADNATIVPTLIDLNSMGNFTRESLSPINLRLSTISDEVAIDGDGLTSVYAIAPDPQQAIIMAGHAGNCALWINDADGQWSSTAWYRDFPQFISRRNRTTPLHKQLDSIRWTPMLRPGLYPGLPATRGEYGFRHTFLDSGRDLYSRFKKSAPVNREVTDVAIDALRELSLGKRPDGIDMLSIGYTAAPWAYAKEGDGRMELQDTYVRLDSQLGRLLDAIDAQVGLENSVIFLSSTGYFNDPSAPAAEFRIPGGDISLKRVESLLNSYLTAKYGNADYVRKVFGNQIYLDHKALAAKTPDINPAIADARDFIVRMSGISDARTLGEILSDLTEEGARIRNSIDPKNAGDIFLTYTPGWNVVDDTRYPSTVSHQRSATAATPFFLMAPGIAPAKIVTPVRAVNIAPTITSTIHIRAPNGATGRPVDF
ncbi:MAG: alkaline phosphatase family protein [Muribaculaceae bacterium]|nr:alkaline phosphatase family protein [Muribaculaceae bacterium]